MKQLSNEELLQIHGGVFEGLGEAFGTVYDKGKDFGESVYHILTS